MLRNLPSRRLRALFFCLILFIFGSGQTFADVITVNDGGGADFTTIQAAINAATPGDVIVIQGGSGPYVLGADLDLSLMNGSSPGDLSITTDGIVTINGGGTFGLTDNGAFNANLAIEGLVFNAAHIVLTDVNDFYLLNCSVASVTGGPAYAVEYNRTAGGGVTYNMTITGCSLSNSDVPGLGIINATDNNYNVVVDDNEFTDNTGGLYMANQSTGEMLATIIDNVADSDGTGRSIDIVNTGSGNAEFYVSSNNAIDAAYAISADYSAGTGKLRIVDNNDGAGGAFIDAYTTAGIAVTVQNGAVVDVEIDNNIFGNNASNTVGIDLQITPNTSSHNIARISNNVINETNSNAGILVNADDAGNSATTDVTIDGNNIPPAASANYGIEVRTNNSIVVDVYVANNTIGGANPYNFNAGLGGSIVFQNTAVDLATTLTDEGNSNGASAIESGTVDYSTGTTVDAITTITPTFANELTDANITGNAPGFGQITSEELVSAQTVAVPLGSKVGVHGAPINGEGQVEPLFNSPAGADLAFYMQKDGNNIISAAALNFTISDPDENALQFNASNGDLVDLPLSGVVPVGSAVRTFELWIKRDRTATAETLFAYGAESTDNFFSLGFVGSDELTFSADGATPLGANLFVTDNDWHHVAITYDGSNNITMFLDGTAGSGVHNIPGLNTTNTNVELGQSFGGGNNFDGAIDEFAIWNTVRSTLNIQADAQGGITLPNASVVAYYKCNQGEEGQDNTLITELIDENLAHGGSFYNGTLVNFTLADSDFESNFVTSLVPTVFAQDIYVTDTRDNEVPDASSASTVYDTDWETQATGYTQGKSYGIHNVGLSDLNITAVGNISISGDAEFTLNLNAGDFPLTITPGSVYYIDVDFTPTAALSYGATVSITSDDPDESPYTFGVAGTGAAQAELDLFGNGNPIEHNNGPSGSTDTWYQLGINSSITKTYTITNNGSASLTSINISSDNADFTVLNWSGAGDISAATGSVASLSSETFDVTYQANNEFFYDEHSAVINILSSGDPNEADYDMNIRAISMDNALHFEGATDGADDRVDISPNTFNPADANDEITVEAWINLDSYGGTNSYIVGRYDESGSTNNGEFYLAVTAAGNLEAGIVAGGSAQILNSSSTIGTGVWTHVAMTYDNTNMKIFINGILEDDMDIIGSASGGGIQNTYIGYTFNAGNNYDGQIDELRIWDLARTPYELRQNALGRLTGSESNLVAYFNFDDGVTEGLSAENALYPPTDLSSSTLATSFVNFDFDGGAGGSSESNYLESFALQTTGLQDIIVTNNYFDGNDNEIADGSTIPTLDIGTFMGRADNGEFITQTYTITNDGLNDLTINSVSAVSGPFSYDQSPGGGTILGPGDSFDLIVRFTGAYGGNSSDNIIINSDDPTSGEDNYTFDIAAYSLEDRALNFDGIDDVVDISNGEDLFNNLSTSDSWTLLTWVKIEDISGINGILSEPGGGGNNSIVINNGTIEVYDGVGSLQGQSAAAIVPEGIWTHIAVVSQNGTGTSFYVNGVLDGAPQASSPASLSIPGTGLTIGDDGNASTGYFDGDIDELIFWNSGFSQTLVQFVMNNTISGNEGGLFAYYRFDNGNVGVVNGGFTTLINSDDSGATYNGTLSGGFDMGAGDVSVSNWVASYVNAPDIVVRGNSAQIDIANGETAFGLSDDREFGSVALDGAGGAVSTVVFDIASIGGVDLDLLSGSSVTFGSATPDFSVTAQPGQNVPSGSVNTFTIEFDPQSGGTKTVTVQISNDSDKNPYTFDIEGFGGALPAIDVESAGGSAITDEEPASVADETDYGDIGIHSPVSRTFTINNTGGAVLNISSIVSNNTDFVVSGVPTTVASLGSETFTVTYQANNDFTYGDDKAATVTINSDDPTFPDYEVNFLVDVTDNSLDFLGSGGADDIVIPTSASLQAINTAVTIEAWIYLDAAPSPVATIYEDASRYALTITNTFQISFVNYNGGATQAYSAASVVSTGQWHHVAATFDGDFVNYYVDGELVANLDHAANGFNANTNSHQLGSLFDGQIDEFRLWSDVRTAQEIRANAAQAVSPASPNLVSYYDFDFGEPGGADNTYMDNSNVGAFTDLTANANDGTLGTGFLLTGGSNNFILSTARASVPATTPNIAVYGQINGNLIADGETTINTTLETDFGTRNLASNTVITYDIVNEGFTALGITAAGDIAVTNSGVAFTEDLTGLSFPLSIAPGATESFSMDFSPASVATFTETVTINSDDPDAEAAYTFNVEGIGANLGVINDVDASDNFTFNEDQGATVIDGATPGTITDADAPANIAGATLTASFTANVEVTEDEFSVNTGGTITLDDPTGGDISNSGTHIGSYAGGTFGTDLVITFNANATLADANTVLQNITYNNINSAVPVASVRTVTFVYNDGSGDSAPANVDITVNPVNDVPVIANLGAADDFTFTEEDGATIIDDGNATITDGDNPADINGNTLTVSVSVNRVDAEDELSVDTGGTITLDDPSVGDISNSGTHIGTFAGGTGASDLVITFNANGDFTDAETVIRSITYNNNNTVNPDPNTRTVSFVFHDGTDPSLAADVDITINPQNDLPSIGNFGPTADNPFLEGGSPVILDADVTFSDPELDLLNDYDGAMITIQRTGGLNTDDVFGFNDNGPYALNAGNIEESSVPIASFDNVAGTLVVEFDFAADPDITDVNTILRNITYSNTNGTPPANVSIDFRPNDGTGTGTFGVTSVDIYNNDADIIDNSTLSATLDYASHTGATVTSANGLKVGEISIRDSGAGADTDGVGTTLDAITLQFTNPTLIQEVALFNQAFSGAALTPEVSLTGVGSDEAVFTGLSGLTAADDGTLELSVVVTFNAIGGITDNANQIDYTVISATAAGTGSQFNAADAGGASPNVITENLVVVIASQMVLTNFAGSSDAESGGAGGDDITISVNTAFSATMEAQDANGNIDLDYDNTVPTDYDATTTALTPANFSGTVTQNWINGVATWNDLVYDASLTSETVTFTDNHTPALTPVTTLAFDVSTATSDIIEDPTFNYPENIDYTQYNATTLNETGGDELQIAQFILRDGGALPDLDGQETELTALTFNVTGWQNIEEMAVIANGVNEIEVSPTSSTVVMNWGNSANTDAADGTQTIIRIYATFKQGIGEITDNEQITLTITAAEDRGGSRTQFIDAAAGGASTANFIHTGDNQMEVKATGFVRVAGDLTNTLSDPFVIERDPGFSLDVEARDANDNIDLDVTGGVDLTFTAGSVISSIPANFTAGTLSLTNVVINNVFANGTFTLDNTPVLVDVNTNGVPDNVDVAFSATTGGSGIDGDGDFIDDSFDESVIATGNDEDGDDIPDLYDLDVADMVYTDITIQDTTTPTVEAFTPANDDLNVVSTTTLTIEFSEDVQIGTGLIDVLNVTDFNTIENIDVTNGSKVALSGKDFTSDLVTITLDNLLPKNKTVAIRIASTAFLDLGTNAYAGISNTTDWDFFLPDNGPVIISTDPVNLEPSASTFTTIVITFDDIVYEPDLIGGTTVDRLNVFGDGATGSIDYNTNGQTSPEVTGYGTNTITITPASAFATAENITVTIPESVFENGNGTEIDNGNSDYVFSFTTNSDITPPDFIDPNVNAVPFNGETLVDVNLSGGTISIEFDDNIQFDDGALRVVANTNPSNNHLDDLVLAQFTEASPELSIVNHELFIDLSAYLPLSGGVEYYVVIGGNLIEDANGNNFAGADGDPILWGFTTDPSLDAIAPSGVSLDPATTSSGVLVNSDMTITYDEPVTLGTGTIQVKLTTTTTPVYSYDVAEDVAPANGTPDVIDNGYITIDGDQVIIDPANNLSGLNTYYVLIANGAVTDYAGNAHGGISSPSTWNFNTAIEGATPTLTSIDLPADDATDVSLFPTFELTMNEPVNGVAGKYIQVRETAAPGVDVLSVEANDILTVSTQGPKITIGPFSDALEDNTEYFVQIEDGGLADQSGNPTVGVIGGDPAWTFTTEMDDTPPSVNSLNAGIGTTITTQDNRTFILEFDEDVTWGAGEINLYYTAADAVAVSTLDVVADLGAGVNTANQVPEDFDVGSPNYVTGTYSFTNAAASGSALAVGGVGDAVSIGTTLGDNMTTPMITNLSAISFEYRSATDAVATDFEVWYSSDGIALDNQLGSTINYTSATYTTFSQSVANAVDGYIIIRSTGAGVANLVVDNFTITSDTRLSFEFDLPSGGTDYYITIDNGAITDVINEAPANYNDFAGYGANEWFFDTSDDLTAPLVNNFAPTGAVDVTSGDQIVLTFNELVNPQGGNIEIRYTSDGKLAHTIPVNAASPVVDNSTGEVTFTYDISDEVGQELSGLTNYYFEIANNEFEDNDGTPLSTGIIGGSGTWDINTTNDGTVPAVVSRTPADDATGVANNSTSIEIDFTERVTASTGNLRLFLVSNDFEIMTVPATEATIEDDTDITGITGSRVTFPIEVVGNTQYYVVLDNDAFRDATSLANAAINTAGANDGSWNFRTAASGPSPSPTLFPDDNIERAVPYSSMSGRFLPGDNITGGTSTETADILFNDESANILYIENESTGMGGLQNAEVISVGATSATTGTISTPTIEIDDNLILKFEGPVFTQTGNFITLTGGPDGPIAISVTDVTQVSGSGTNIITVNPTNPLHAATTYTITVDAGAFTDNDSQGNALINTWTITTESGAVVDNDAAPALPPAVTYDTPTFTACLFGDDINQTALQPIVIGELNNDDFDDGAVGGVTLVLTLNGDFAFDAGGSITVTNDNLTGNLSNLNGSINTGTNEITITYDNDGNNDQLDAIRITGLSIRLDVPGGGIISSTGTITRTGGTANIYGLDSSHGISILDLDVESVSAPTINTYTNNAFCQDIDPDDVDGMGGVDEPGDFDLTLNAATNVVWYPEDGGSPGNPDYASPIGGIGDPLDPTFAELLGLAYQTAGTYKVYATQTNSNGCESDNFLEVTIEIRTLPDAEAAAGADLTGICSHEDIQIGDAGNSALDAAGYTFAWAGDNMGSTTADPRPAFPAPDNTSAAPDPYSSTDPHTYTLTLTDNNGCVSDPGITAEMVVTLDRKVQTIVQSSNGQSFSETLDTPQPILGDRTTFNNGDGNLSGYTGFFVGIPGLGNTATSSINQHTASFTPSDAGSGLHTIEYVLEENATGCADTASVVISVAVNITDLFDVDPEPDICELDVLPTLDNENTTLGTNTFVRFTHPVGGVISGTDNVATGWTFDPALAYAQADDGLDVIEIDDTKLIRISRVVNDGGSDFVDGTFTFTIHPQPTVAITSVGVTGVSDNFCSDDSDVTITGSVTNDAGAQALTITNYEIRQVSPVSTAFETIAGTDLRFDELLTHTGIYAGISASTAGEGLYEIRVTSDAGDDAYGDPPGCTNTQTAQFNLFAKPNTPTIALVGGVDPVAQVNFEFCEDEIPANITLDLQGITGENFEWSDDSFVSTIATLSTNGSVATASELGIVAPGGEQQTYTYEVRRRGFENSPFVGCLSDVLTINITIYNTQPTPELITYTTGSDQGQSDGTILLEYCVGDALVDLQADVSSYAASSLPGDSYFNWYYDNTADGIPETFINSTDEFLTVAEMDAVLANIADVSNNALTPGTYTFGFTQTDFDTGAGSGSFIYNGCESDMRTINIDINAIPSDIVTADGFTTEYFTCEGSAIANITTINESGIVYTWYGDDGDGIFEPGADDDVIKEGGSIDDSELQSSTSNAYNNGAPGTYYFWVTRKSDRNTIGIDATNFDGCESAEILIAATVFENYNDEADQPDFEGYGAGVGEVGDPIVLNFCNDELSASDTFSATSSFTDITTFSTLAEGTNYTAFKRFNWYTSDASGNKNSLLSNAAGDDGATGEGSVITAQELFLVGIPSDQTNYFLLTQTTNELDGGTIDAGCEGPGVLIQVNTFDIPAAPVEDKESDGLSKTTIYVCESDALATIQVEGEDEDGVGAPTGTSVTFYWYNNSTDANAGTNRLTVADGKNITAAELVPDELNDAGGAVADLSSLAGNEGTYTFYVTQSTDITAGPPAFTGCESLPTQITIEVLGTPDNPIVNAVANSCNDAVAYPVAVATNVTAGSELRWYQLSGQDPLSDAPDATSTFASPTFDSDPFFGFEEADAKIFYAHKVEYEDIDGLGFVGCASASETAVPITVFAEPESPYNTANNLVVGTRSPQVEGQDEYEICEASDVSGTSFSVDNFVGGGTVRWYTTGPFTGPTNQFASGTSVDFATVAAFTGLDINTPATTTIYATQFTDGTCESFATSIDIVINPLPEVEIVDTGESSGGTLTEEFCFDESTFPRFDALLTTVDGSPNDGQWRVDGVNATAVGGSPRSIDFEIDTYYNGTYADTGETGRGDVDGGQTETYALEYTYTDANGCTVAAVEDGSIETITINPRPFVYIFDQETASAYPGTPVRYCAGGNSLAAAGSPDDQISIQGIFGTTAGSGTFSMTGEDNNEESLTTSANQSSFSLTVLGDSIDNVNYRSYDLKFSAVATGTGCTNDTIQVIEVQALPEVTFENINGGCENPAVEFVPETIWDATGGLDGKNLDYVIADDDLVLTWEYYRTSSDGSANEDEPYPPTDQTYDPFAANGSMTIDPNWENVLDGDYNIATEDGDGDVRDFGRTNITEKFLLDDPLAESETFAIRLRVYTNDANQCLNDYEDEQYATKSLTIKISPNPAFRWENVALGEPTKFYMRETRLEADEIEDIFLFWDQYVVFDKEEGTLEDVNGVHVTANDTISKTLAYTVPIPTVNLPGEANDVFEYEIDVTSADPDKNPFTEARQYTVTVAFRTNNECFSTIAKPVTIVPSIDVVGDYGGTYHQTFGPTGDGTNAFDLITSGWFPENLRDDVLSIADSASSIRPYSWTHGDLNDGSGNGMISNSVYPQLEGSDGYAWHTAGYDADNDSYNYLSSEDSWIYSPSFDITGMNRPMVKFSMIYNFGAGNEGAVLQHSTDGGVTWVPLGSYETDTRVATGIEWFDFDNVQADPGQQTAKFGALTALGWAGAGGDDDETVEWVSSRHSLDAIRTYLEEDLGLTDEAEIQDRLSNVRFRFAMAATNLDDNEGYFGFALDDFTIQERTKNVLIEQFVSVTNETGSSAEALNDATGDLKDAINALIPAPEVEDRDEVMLAYHSDFGFEDPFNAVNPAGPSARTIYYNVDEVTSILDGQFGGSTSTAKSGDLTWTSNQLSLRSLRDPGFDIVLTPDPSAEETEVKGTVEFVANQDYAAKTEFRAYVVIMEDTVIRTVEDFQGFGHVMRKMLPSGSGEFVKLSEELAAGESLMFTDDNGDPTNELSIEWNLANIRDDSELSAIVFIQNNKTKEIYQSVKIENAHSFVSDKNAATVTDAGDLLTEASDYNMYPNPADHEVFILFDQRVHEDMNWVVFDQTGRVFDQGTVSMGHEGFSLPTHRFPSGVYYMSIKGEKTKFEFRKLAITH